MTMGEFKPSVHDGVEYLRGTAGGLILACSTCGHEAIRDAFYYWNHPPVEMCSDCQKLMEPIRMDELVRRWYPFWRGLGIVVTSDPHAIRVHFPNKDKGWRLESRLLYFDGYSVDGEEDDTEEATQFRDLTLFGVTDERQALALARLAMKMDYPKAKVPA